MLEACAGGTLIEAIAGGGGRLPERVVARRVAAPLLRALAHLHGRGVVHRDVKPEHVLLTPDGGLRLADFAVAALLPGAPPPPPSVPEEIRRRSVELRRSIEALHARHHLQQQQQQQQHHHQQQQQQQQREAGKSGAGASGGGSGEQQQPEPQQQPQQQPEPEPPQPDVLNHRVAGAAVEYMAPEVLSKPTAAEVFHLVVAHGLDEAELPAYDEKADVWAAGCLAFEALTGRQPFLADGVAEMAAVVGERLRDVDAATGLPAFIAALPGVSADAKAFLAAALTPRPEARPSAAALLAHPWLAACGPDEADAAADAGAAAAAQQPCRPGSASGGGHGGGGGGGGAPTMTRCMSEALPRGSSMCGAAAAAPPAAAAAAAAAAASLTASGPTIRGAAADGVRRSLSLSTAEADLAVPPPLRAADRG